MDNNCTAELNTNGFTIFNLLNEVEVSYLQQLCTKYLPNSNTDFISSSHFLNEEESNFINQELHTLVRPKIQTLFPNLELLGGTLATKNTGRAILKAHRDWSIVDENMYNSYNLWIPLVHTNKNNGTLGLFPRSHLWAENYRGLNIPSVEEHTDKIIQYGFEPNLNAGDAILYNHKLIHFSKPNTTKIPRNVAIIGMKDKNATLQVSFSLDSINIETYEVSQNDFYNFDIEKIQQIRKLLHKRKMNSTRLSSKELIQKIKDNLVPEFSEFVPKRESFFSKLLQKLRF
ncbi:MAG: phytanoyl-CoA dioxygenase family protein [Chitinophagales bacterium]